MSRSTLVEAAIEALAADGPRAVTSVNVARAAGLAQSGFYRYFHDPQDCLRAAAEAVTDRLRALHVALWQTLLLADPADVDATTRYYETWLDAVLVEARLARLLFRHRHDRSPLGQALRRHVDSMRDDMTIWLRRIVIRAGVEAAPEQELRLLAELLLAEALGLCEALLDGRQTEVPLVARALARSAIDATTRMVVRLGATPSRSGRMR